MEASQKERNCEQELCNTSSDDSLYINVELKPNPKSNKTTVIVMKRILPIFTLTLSMVLFASTGFAQKTDKEMPKKKQQMMEMMQDSTMRTMMIQHMARNPQMRQQMMQKMMDNIKMDSTMMKDKMKKMMKNPQMKQRMQKHMQMMQSMMDGKQMDQSKMMSIKGDSSMMKMHMMCMQMMMQGDKMDGKGMMDKDGKETGNGNREQNRN